MPASDDFKIDGMNLRPLIDAASFLLIIKTAMRFRASSLICGEAGAGGANRASMWRDCGVAKHIVRRFVDADNLCVRHAR